MEKAEVAVNIPVVFVSAMAMCVKGRCVQSDHRSLVGWAPLGPLAAY